jgi:uncharacterized damage-inducible protein DinB
MSVESEFLKYSADKLAQSCARIETCLDKLKPEQIWSRHADNENAVGNLALHLTGNLRQWIVSGIGGEPFARDRDQEFAARGGAGPAGLKQHLRSAVDAAAALIRSLPHSRLTERVTIQSYDVTVLEAIYHVVEHFSGHTGQVIFATKLLTGEDLGFHAHLSRARAHSEKTP